MTVSELVESLGRKVGPLPLGVWLGAGAAGVAFGAYRKRQAAAAAAAVAAEAPQRSVAADPGVGLGGTYVTVAPAAATAAAVGYRSNSEWVAAASSLLIGLGYPADVVDAALRKYAHSQVLSVQEQSVVTVAITRLGVPPDQLSPVEAAVPNLVGYFRRKDVSGQVDPAVYAAYDDNTYKWVNGGDWQAIVQRNSGIAPAITDLEAGHELWSWKLIGLHPPSWLPSPPQSPVVPVPTPVVPSPARTLLGYFRLWHEGVQAPEINAAYSDNTSSYVSAAQWVAARDANGGVFPFVAGIDFDNPWWSFGTRAGDVAAKGSPGVGRRPGDPGFSY